LKIELPSDWQLFLDDEINQDYFALLLKFVQQEYEQKSIYPPAKDIFRAFNLIGVDDVKVVILGQDPYHGASQANGLAFAVRDGIKAPPSLQNIIKELKSDIGCDGGNLDAWAKNGVLLINSVLSVEESKPNSHAGIGWERFTDAIISKLSNSKDGCVFMLWGAYAQKKASLIDEKKHLIISSAHPSPLSAYRGFFGSKPFSRANEYLKKCGKKPIIWCKNTTLF
jgi:uracil-DNA glycosylase